MNKSHSCISLSDSFNVRDPKTHMVFQASALARVGPPVIFLQAQRSCAISSFRPIAFMSHLTQLLDVFLGAPLSTTQITFILDAFLQGRNAPPFAQHAQTILTFLSVSCSQHIQFPNGSRVHRCNFLICLNELQSGGPSYHHPLGPPQPSQVLRFDSTSLATIYQHSLYRCVIY